MRFELTTLTLARLCSTPELRPRPMTGLYTERQSLDKPHPQRLPEGRRHEERCGDEAAQNPLRPTGEPGARIGNCWQSRYLWLYHSRIRAQNGPHASE